MATVLGKAGFLFVSSLTVLQFRGYTLNHTSDTVEDTVIGDDFKTRLATLQDFRISGDLYLRYSRRWRQRPHGRQHRHD
jgi:hypothetical protein